jgi:hypothetical protein
LCPGATSPHPQDRDDSTTNSNVSFVGIDVAKLKFDVMILPEGVRLTCPYDKRNRQQIASLAGLATFSRDSGQFRGQRSIWGGRGSVRCALYMAAFNAKRSNPVIRAFAERLKRLGNRPKVILPACMRKLLVILNTMVRNQTAWKSSVTLPIT